MKKTSPISPGNDMTIKTICVFCASSASVDEIFKNAAMDLGILMGQKGIDLVYGGARIGLMGCVARGVHQESGRVVGVIPEFFMGKDIDYIEADELIISQSMRERKAEMDQLADAFIVLPGGIGTLEEVTEILSMKQLKLSQKPLVFLNIEGFFNPLVDYFKEMIDLKFAKKETLNLFGVVSTPEEALDYILNFKAPQMPKKWFDEEAST